MILGYGRVSSADQNLEVQIEQLTKAGCDKIFAEKKSGKTMEGREELEKCLKYARDGDTIIVCRLDRFARSMADFCELVRLMQEKGVGFKCLNPGLDTTGPVGELTAQILMAVAQFELSLRAERQREGIEKAKKKGTYHRSITAKAKKRRQTILDIMEKYPNEGVTQWARMAGISVRTVYRLCPEVKRFEVPERLRLGQERKKALREPGVTF